MLVAVDQLLKEARQANYAVGAFNIYNMEGASAVIRAAEKTNSPCIIQVGSAMIDYGDAIFIDMILQAIEKSKVKIGLHLDHCSSKGTILKALDLGISSIMADGSDLDFEGNINFVKEIAEIVHARGGVVEGELGKIAGTEDGILVEGYQEMLTNPLEVEEYIERSGVDSLAVCIGNVHGSYNGTPQLDFPRLEEINKLSSVPLVLHGASGLPAWMIEQSIKNGVCKINVNSEIRSAYRQVLEEGLGREDFKLQDIVRDSIQAMEEVVSSKISLFRR